MRFILMGFAPDTGFRVFTFQGIDTDHTRTDFSVRADLALARRYGIRLQELPLLCRAFLEGQEDLARTHDVTFTEADMCRHQRDCAATQRAAALKKKPPRRPSVENAGSPWRTAPSLRLEDRPRENDARTNSSLW